MFADLASIHPRIYPKTPGRHSLASTANPGPHSQRSSFRTRQSPISNNHRPQRIGLSGHRRTPAPLMESVPPFRGINKIADPHCESTEILRTFDILKVGCLPCRGVSKAGYCRFDATNPNHMSAVPWRRRINSQLCRPSGSRTSRSA